MIDPTTNQDLATGSGTLSSPSLGMRASTGNGHDRIHRFAGTVHRAIDDLEQRLGSAGGGMSSTQERFGRQARQYGDRLRTRMHEQPLQSTGVMLAAGVLLDRLFLRKPKVRVVQVPVRARSTWDTGPSFAGTRDTVSSLAREADAVPLRMRLATQRLMARSQEYGSMARSTVEAHPWAGLGAVLAASGLLTSLLMRRREPSPGTYGTVDERGRGIGWQRSEYDGEAGLGEMISARPVLSAAVVLGLGTLALAMLRRPTE